MTEEQKEKRLKERLRANYEAYIRTLQAELPPDLIDQAAEIAAAKLVYQELQENGCPREFVDYLLRFENEFAQRLVELGCNINQRDRYGFTALRYAVQDKNYEMAEYLLSCPGVELQDVTPSMDDRMDSILVRGGCDIFLSCCALIYRHYSGDKHCQAEARRAAKRAGELLAMGISLTQPDFTGKTPQDHLREAGLTGLLP